jgi:hypothetical protein
MTTYSVTIGFFTGRSEDYRTYFIAAQNLAAARQQGIQKLREERKAENKMHETTDVSCVSCKVA